MSSEQEEISVSVSRSFHASAEQVFDAWLQPTMICEWMFGPKLRDERIVRLEVDARVGGRFSFVVQRGEQELDHTGVYREIDRPKRLVFTWGIAGMGTEESVVEINIAGTPSGCELALTHRMHPKWSEYRERTAQGWATMLAALDRELETGGQKGG